MADESKSLRGKTAIVTGSSRGIGAAIATALGRQGAHVVVTYSSPRGRAVLVQADMARLADLAALVQAALESCCKVWATELGKAYQATVNCVAPGPVATDMWWDSDPQLLADFQPIIDATPAAARVGEVADIVPVVLFLCSEASRWVTGSVVSASGGMTFVG